MVNPLKLQKLPLQIDYNEFARELCVANRNIAKYDSLLETIPNNDLYFTPLFIKEAILSSSFDGISTSLLEFIEFNTDNKLIQDSSRINNIDKAINYYKAMQYAINELKRLSISTRLMYGMHKILLNNGKSQDQIHPQSDFLPPSTENLTEYIFNLNTYINSEEKDYIIQAALIHAQLELLNPFLDGNGGIARMILPLFFFKKGIIHKPLLCISSFFFANKKEYYINLNTILNENNWTPWIKFYISAINNQTQNNVQILNNINNIYNKNKIQLCNLLRSNKYITVLDALFKIPVFKQKHFVEKTCLPRQTASRFIKTMLDNGIIVSSSHKKKRTYFFKELISFLENI